MTLPVSAEYPVTSILQYQMSAPPLVPNIQVLPDGQPIMVMICAIVANEASAQAMNSPARMFCYNLISSNGWNNSLYADVVKLAIDACLLRARAGRASPSAYLREAVEEILAIYTGVLVMSYPELQRMVSSETMAAAAQNQAMFYDLERAVAQMYGSQGGYVSPSAGVRVGAQPQGRPMQAAGGHPAAVGLTTRSAAQQPPRPNLRGSFPSSGAFSTNPPQAPQAPSVPTAPPVAPAPQPAPSVLTGEIESMDREQHSIAYFGKQYTIPTAPLRRSLEVVVEAMEKTALDDKQLSPVVEEVWLYETSLDTLLNDIRARVISATPLQELKAVLNFGMVVTPVLSQVSIRVLFESLSTSATFRDVSLKITGWLEEIDPSHLRAGLNVAAQLDRQLTKLVNQFLKGVMVPKFLKIDSFVEDAPELANYLSSKYGQAHYQAYTRFQQRTLSHLFKHLTDMDPLAAELYDELAGVDGLIYDLMAQFYGVLYVTASSQDLGYKVDESGVIVSGKTPMLSRLLAALQEVQEKRFMPSKLVILTADDRRWLVVEAAGEPGNYSLTEI